MKLKKETTTAEPAAAVGEATTKETVYLSITMRDEHDKIQAFALADKFAADFSFWRRRAEQNSAVRAIRNYIRVGVAAIKIRRRGP